MTRRPLHAGLGLHSPYTRSVFFILRRALRTCIQCQLCWSTLKVVPFTESVDVGFWFRITQLFLKVNTACDRANCFFSWTLVKLLILAAELLPEFCPNWWTCKGEWVTLRFKYPLKNVFQCLNKTKWRLHGTGWLWNYMIVVCLFIKIWSFLSESIRIK